MHIQKITINWTLKLISQNVAHALDSAFSQLVKIYSKKLSNVYLFVVKFFMLFIHLSVDKPFFMNFDDDIICSLNYL